MNIDEPGETASDSVNSGFPVVRIVRDIWNLRLLSTD